MGKNNKDFIVGSIIGGLVGAATALFLAPKSGKEIRDNLGQQANVMKDRTGKFTNGALEKGSGIASVAKEKTASLSQVLTEQSSQIMNKVRDIKSTSNGQGDFVEKEVADALEQISGEASTSNTNEKTEDQAISESITEAVEAFEEDDKKEQPKADLKDEVKSN
jgi:gas vesicle protein